VIRIFLACLFALLAFAANSLLCRAALRDTAIDPATFTSVRIAAGAAALFILLKLTQPQVRMRVDWLAPLALIAYAIAFSFAYVELTAGTGALLLFGTVQLVMLAAGLKFGERMALAGFVGWVITVAGVVVLVAPGVTAPPLLPAISMAIAGAAWALYTLRGRGSKSPLSDTTINFLAALPVAILINAILWRRASFDSRGLVLAAVSGALASGMGYAAWYSVLPRLRAITAANLQLSVPVIAAAGGIIFFREQVTSRLLAAAVLVLSGIALATRRRAAVSRSAVARETPSS
jgi:drug/metabolite transporter (DMT)-like permease